MRSHSERDELIFDLCSLCLSRVHGNSFVISDGLVDGSVGEVGVEDSSDVLDVRLKWSHSDF